MAKAPDAREDQALLDWIEANTTLHTQVEFLYVVDGYTCEITHDGNATGITGAGATIREAGHACMRQWAVRRQQ